MYSQFVFQTFIDDNQNSATTSPTSASDKENVDLYGNQVFDSYSICKPDYEDLPKTRSINIFKKKPKPYNDSNNDYGIIPIVNADAELLQESLFNAINKDGIDYENFEPQKSYNEIMQGK